MSSTNVIFSVLCQEMHYCVPVLPVLKQVGLYFKKKMPLMSSRHEQSMKALGGLRETFDQAGFNLDKFIVKPEAL